MLSQPWRVRGQVSRAREAVLAIITGRSRDSVSAVQQAAGTGEGRRGLGRGMLRAQGVVPAVFVTRGLMLGRFQLRSAVKGGGGQGFFHIWPRHGDS